ncbi:hypothetical protein M0805_002255 [Coniferiporia weirii]|nr:hypothetical protein M0805_002255 [Coniferiporia weirii]
MISYFLLLMIARYTLEKRASRKDAVLQRISDYRPETAQNEMLKTLEVVERHEIPEEESILATPDVLEEERQKCTIVTYRAATVAPNFVNCDGLGHSSDENDKLCVARVNEVEPEPCEVEEYAQGYGLEALLVEEGASRATGTNTEVRFTISYVFKVLRGLEAARLRLKQASEDIENISQVLATAQTHHFAKIGHNYDGQHLYGRLYDGDLNLIDFLSCLGLTDKDHHSPQTQLLPFASLLPPLPVEVDVYRTDELNKALDDDLRAVELSRDTVQRELNCDDIGAGMELDFENLPQSASACSSHRPARTVQGEKRSPIAPRSGYWQHKLRKMEDADQRIQLARREREEQGLEKTKKGKGKNAHKKLPLRSHPDDDKDTRVSKKLSWILRHGAKTGGLKMRSDGYVRVSDLLALPQFRHIPFQTLERIVQHDAKNRYHLLFEPMSVENDTSEEIWWIRANQGHSLQEVDLQFPEITDAGQVAMAIHGTTRAAWAKIEKEGLSPMKRAHIHLAQHFSHIKGLNMDPGIRSRSEVLIYIDLDRALRAGIKFYISSNGVVLTKGDESGFLRPEFFKRVTDTKDRPLRGWSGVHGSPSPRSQSPHGISSQKTVDLTQSSEAGSPRVDEPQPVEEVIPDSAVVEARSPCVDEPQPVEEVIPDPAVVKATDALSNAHLDESSRRLQ